MSFPASNQTLFESQVRKGPLPPAARDFETLQKSAELYFLDNSGMKRDAEPLEGILNNPTANIAADYAAMKQAIDSGMTLVDAAALFASPKTLKWQNGRSKT